MIVKEDEKQKYLFFVFFYVCLATYVSNGENPQSALVQ